MYLETSSVGSVRVCLHHYSLLDRSGDLSQPVLTSRICSAETCEKCEQHAVQCVDHQSLSVELFVFLSLGLELDGDLPPLECVCFDHLSRSKWNVPRSGQEHV